METSMKMINPLILNVQITTAAAAAARTTTLFLPKLHPHNVKYRIYCRTITPHNISLRTKSVSNVAVFPSPNFPQLKLGFGFFLSLSSSSADPNLQLPIKSQPSDGNFFTWNRPPSNSPVAAGFDGDRKPEVAAVVLGWLGATQKHLRRYAEMYTSRGFDAITFVVPVKDLMRFDLGRKVENRIEMLANELVSWLSNHGGRNRSLVFHTFSTTGWLVYGSILGHVQGRPDLIEKIKGCIVDSGGDPDLNPKVWAAGFGAAMLKKRNVQVSPLTEAKPGHGSDNNKPKLQEDDPNVLADVVHMFLEIMFTFTFKFPPVTQKLLKIISRLSENQPQCPQLYLYSTADKVIPYRSVESFMDLQKSRGRNVQSFNFGSSPHVDHYRTFPDVYTSLVNRFIDEILVMAEPA